MSYFPKNPGDFSADKSLIFTTKYMQNRYKRAAPKNFRFEANIFSDISTLNANKRFCLKLFSGKKYNKTTRVFQVFQVMFLTPGVFQVFQVFQCPDSHIFVLYLTLLGVIQIVLLSIRRREQSLKTGETRKRFTCKEGGISRRKYSFCIDPKRLKLILDNVVSISYLHSITTFGL